MVSASDTDKDFTIGKTGGSKTHSHSYGLVYGVYFGMAVLNVITNNGLDYHTGVINYDSQNGNRVNRHTNPHINHINAGYAKTVDNSYGVRDINMKQSEGNVQRVSSMDPYVAVYIWRRIA